MRVEVAGVSRSTTCPRPLHLALQAQIVHSLTAGAGSGIGAAAVRCFAAAGAKVIYASDIVDKNLQTVADGVKQEGYGSDVIGVKTDITKANQVEELVRKVIKEHGRLDWFVRIPSTSTCPLSCRQRPRQSQSLLNSHPHQPHWTYRALHW